jgi:hypothetical protein
VRNITVPVVSEVSFQVDAGSMAHVRRVSAPVERRRTAEGGHRPGIGLPAGAGDRSRPRLGKSFAGHPAIQNVTFSPERGRFADSEPEKRGGSGHRS